MKPDLQASHEKKRIQRRDSHLIKECLKGKTAAFAELMALYQNRVQAIGFSFFHNMSDTEDFTQEVFLKVYSKLESFKGESLFSTWLTRIAYTTAVNAKERRKEYESIADETVLPSLIRTPEELQIRTVTAEAIKEAVAQLPENYASCLDFYFFYDMSYEEIASVTGFPINTIKSHIFRAKKILRQKLADFAT